MRFLIPRSDDRARTCCRLFEKTTVRYHLGAREAGARPVRPYLRLKGVDSPPGGGGLATPRLSCVVRCTAQVFLRQSVSADGRIF